MSFLLLYFQRSFFELLTNERLFKYVVKLQLFGLLLLLIPIKSDGIAKIVLLPIQIILVSMPLILVVYMLYITYESFKQKKKGAEFLYVLFISHTVYVLLMAFKFFNKADLNYLTMGIQLISVSVVALFMSYLSSESEKERENYLNYLTDFNKLKNDTFTKLTHDIQVPIYNMYRLSNLPQDSDYNTQHDIIMAFHKEMVPLLDIMGQLTEIDFESQEQTERKIKCVELRRLNAFLEELSVYLPVQKVIEEELQNLNVFIEASYAMENTDVGMGLNFTKKITQSYQGSFEIDSKLNDGTTAVLHLPIAPSIQAKMGNLPIQPYHNFIVKGINQHSVLLVSDENKVQNIIIETLSKEGYSLYVTDDLITAKQWLSHKRTKAFCMDMRDLYNPVELPIVLLSFLAQSNSLQAAFENRYNVLLIKPINP